MDFKIVNGILNWDDGSCMPATDEHLAMWEKINQLQAEIERLRSERRWIPVSERLPDGHGKYLVFLKDDYLAYQFVAIWDCQNWSCDLRPEISHVTHWKPLPEAPAGEQAND